MLLEKTGNSHEIIITAPCFYKKQISGWIIAWLDPDSMHRNFMGSSLDRSSKRFSLTLANGEFVHLQKKSVRPFPQAISREILSGIKNLALIPVIDPAGSDSQMLLTRIQIQNLPIYLTALVKREEIMGHLEGWQLLAGTGAFIFLLLMGLLLFTQAKTRNLILEVRFEEAERQQDLLVEKNQQLKDEILKREKAELVLKENEKRYRKLFESSTDSILIVKNNRITACNQRTADLLGMDLHTIIGQTVYTFCPDIQPDGLCSQDKAIEKLTLALAEPQSFECSLKTSANQIVETEVNMTAMALDSEACIQVIIRDITGRKQAEAEKLIAQKIADENGKQALIGRIAGKMAHDFNNILGIIMGNSELAMRSCPHTQTKKTLELIFKQTIRGKNLTKKPGCFRQRSGTQAEIL